MCVLLIFFWERRSVAKGHVGESVFLVILRFHAEFTQLECAAHRARQLDLVWQVRGVLWSGGCHWVPARFEFSVHGV